MHRTIFTTPLVNTALRGLSLAFLRVKGWQVEGSLPAHAEKCVLIAAPHTSNWDLPYTLMVAFVLRLNVYWVGKSSLFKWPFGPVMRWLGGIAVNRAQSTNMVAASAQALQAADGRVQLVVAPEGTRGRSGETGKALEWKTGFYYIAQGAGVPILMAYLDYTQKRGGLGPTLTPSGDIQKDMETVKAFYAPIQGRHARQVDGQ
jgi:1-acyl-sn-glycerol-3-phosphate acyltransferase